MFGTLIYSYLIFDLGITCTKIHKLNSIMHGKNALLNNSENQRLGFNPCKIPNSYYIFIKQKTNCSLICTEYLSVAIVTIN